MIQGLEGLKGFGAGHSQLSLAVVPCLNRVIELIPGDRVCRIYS